MKPLHHAKSSVRKYGGCVDDYIEIHSLIDYPKSTLADARHRVIFHNTLGPWIAEKVFGTYITNSNGREVSVRQIAEDHIVEDVGMIPTLERCLRNLPIDPMMDRVASMRQRKKVIDFNED